jgi:hypothetical protein
MDRQLAQEIGISSIDTRSAKIVCAVEWRREVTYGVAGTCAQMAASSSAVGMS